MTLALRRSINRSQRHKYGLLDFTLFDQHKPLFFFPPGATTPFGGCILQPSSWF